MKELIIQYLKENHQNRLDEIIKENELSNVKKSNNSIIIDYTNFYSFLKQEGRHGTIEKLDQLIEVIQSSIGNLTGSHDIQVRFDNVCQLKQVPLKELTSKHIDYWCSCNALIKNVSPIYPKPYKLHIICPECSHATTIYLGNNKTVPVKCSQCGSHKIDIEAGDYIDQQILKLEEPLENRTQSQSREFKAYIERDLVNPDLNLVNPGDVINFFGVLSVEHKNDKIIFSININNLHQLSSSYEEIEITPKDEEEIISLSEDPEIFNKFIDSIAPHITGYKEVKAGLVLQQFGSYRLTDHDRANINVLIVGDPGIAKSQMLRYIADISPKGFYTSGSTSTAVGLTAAAVKDEITGGWTIEAGPLVLADQGIVCIDEIDKMKGDQITALNEALEDQQVSNAKAGLNMNMNARSSVLAAGNPKYSRFDSYKKIREQIQIPDSTLSRFDLVFALEDCINEDKDRKLAEAVLNKTKHFPKIDKDLFRKYIAYAKRKHEPELTEDVKNIITDFFVKTRQNSTQTDDGKPITVRDLEAIERLIIARARVNLRDKTIVNDAKESIAIYRAALKTVGLEPETAGDLSGSHSQKEIKNIEAAEIIIKNTMQEYGDIIPNAAFEDIKAEIRYQCDIDSEDEIKKVFQEAHSNIIREYDNK